MRRSDLICESGIINDEEYASCVHNCSRHGTDYTDISVNEDTEKRLGIKRGRYITVFTEKGDPKRCITELLGEMIPDGSVLVVGLGSDRISSDSIGVKALRHIPATAHLSGHSDFISLGMRSVFVMEAGVTGKTGIESSGIAECIAHYTGVGCVIAMDSLACSELGRLCATVQITDTGIAPGSGVGNDRKPLNSETAGVPVIAIGVPTVIDLDSISDIEGSDGLMVTPRSIDTLSDSLAECIGTAVSLALNPLLTESELRSLII